MVSTRSTAPILAWSPSINGTLAPESSDEDDDGIPNRPALSTSKHNGVVTLRPRDHVSSVKRPRNAEVTSSSRVKRQKTSDAPGSITGSLLPTAPRTAGVKEASNESSSPDGENEVSDELLKCVSSMLKPRNIHEQQRILEESPSEQLLREERLRAMAHENSGHRIQVGVEEHSEQHVETNKSHSGDVLGFQGDTSTLSTEPIVTSESLNVEINSRALTNNRAHPSPALQRQLDDTQGPYGILGRPRTIRPKDTGSISSKFIVLLKGSFKESKATETTPSQPTPVMDSENRDQDVTDSAQRIAPAEIDVEVQSEEELEYNPPIALSAGGDVDVRDGPEDEAVSAREGHTDGESPEEKDDRARYHHDNASPAIENLDAEAWCDTDIELSSKEIFSRDVELFRNRRVPEGEILSEVFRGPPQADRIAIHIDPYFFKQALRLMRFKGWTGLGSTWQSKLLDEVAPRTQAGRHVMLLLARLNRLYLLTPRAPELINQNTFLAEYSDMITYHFSKINAAVFHILDGQLARPEPNQSAASQVKEKPIDIAEELVALIIPMILRVVASAWTLGGPRKDNTLFTRSTAEFLGRGIGWVRRLYHWARDQLSKGEPEALSKKKVWEAKQQKRGDLCPLLQRLTEQIRDVPTMLQAKQHEEMEKHKWQQKQKAIEMQRKQEEDEWQRHIKEQNRRAFLSIKGTKVNPPRSPRRLAENLAFHRPIQQQWSREEKEFLFKELRRSYPQLPDLAGYVCQELNRNLEDIKGMVKILLRAMLKEVYEGIGEETSAPEREAEIRNLFRSSGYNYHR